ncbi:MAG: AAA family ATPase [Sporichthyaceae bacterium]
MSTGPAPDAGRLWPLTGRDAEVHSLREIVTAGRPGSVVLVGSAGVGKTRLAREAQALAEAAGRTTQWITATHSTQRTPLGAFAPLLPPPAADTVEDLLHASARAIAARAVDTRLVLFVDDAQLLDELSLGLLHQLISTDTVAAVLTVRSGDLPDPVTALWKDDLAVRLEIARLTRAQIADLLDGALGGQVDPAAVVELGNHSGGNVLFLRELVLGAVQDGNLVQDMGVWRLQRALAPSERIVELVAARLRGLGEPAQRVLELAAYAEPLGSAELDALAEPELVESLERHGLLVAARDGQRLQVRLAHPIYADVIRLNTSPLRVAAMGRELAAVVEGFGARRRGDALRVGIWRSDGGGGRPDVLLRAATAARRRLDFPLAENLARAAAAVGAGLPARLLAAQAAALDGRPQDAVDQYVKLREAAADDAERALVAAAHVETLWAYLGHAREGLRVASQAEASISDRALLQELAGGRTGLQLALEGPGPAALEALPLLADARGPSLVWLRLVAAYGLGRLGRLAEALEVSDAGLAFAMSVPDPGAWYPWFNLYTRCEALAHLGEFSAARTLARAEYAEGLEAGSSERRAYFLWHLARSPRECGHPHDAAHDAREAVTLFRRVGRSNFAHGLLSSLALALALTGDYREANRVLVAAESLDVEPPQWSTTDHLAARGWTAVAEGRLSAGRTALLEAADAGHRIGDFVGEAAALHDVARLGAPQQVLARLESVSRRIEGALVQARLRHVRALVASDAPALAECADAFLALGADLLAAEAAADSAVAWRKAGRADRGEKAAHRAAELAHACGSPATPALAPLEAREQLTAAERETALLALTGKTNREIAEELQLSVRTVDNRMQRIYQKLGISKRSELAGLLH